MENIKTGYNFDFNGNRLKKMNFDIKHLKMKVLEKMDK
jgi:hypothetical protein